VFLTGDTPLNVASRVSDAPESDNGPYQVPVGQGGATITIPARAAGGGFTNTGRWAVMRSSDPDSFTRVETKASETYAKYSFSHANPGPETAPFPDTDTTVDVTCASEPFVEGEYVWLCIWQTPEFNSFGVRYDETADDFVLLTADELDTYLNYVDRAEPGEAELVDPLILVGPEGQNWSSFTVSETAGPVSQAPYLTTAWTPLSSLLQPEAGSPAVGSAGSSAFFDFASGAQRTGRVLGALDVGTVLPNDDPLLVAPDAPFAEMAGAPYAIGDVITAADDIAITYGGMGVPALTLAERTIKLVRGGVTTYETSVTLQEGDEVSADLLFTHPLLGRIPVESTPVTVAAPYTPALITNVVDGGDNALIVLTDATTPPAATTTTHVAGRQQISYILSVTSDDGAGGSVVTFQYKDGSSPWDSVTITGAPWAPSAGEWFMGLAGMYPSSPDEAPTIATDTLGLWEGGSPSGADLFDASGLPLNWKTDPSMGVTGMSALWILQGVDDFNNPPPVGWADPRVFGGAWSEAVSLWPEVEIRNSGGDGATAVYGATIFPTGDVHFVGAMAIDTGGGTQLGTNFQKFAGGEDIRLNSNGDIELDITGADPVVIPAANVAEGKWLRYILTVSPAGSTIDFRYSWDGGAWQSIPQQTGRSITFGSTMVSLGGVIPVTVPEANQVIHDQFGVFEGGSPDETDFWAGTGTLQMKDWSTVSVPGMSTLLLWAGIDDFNSPTTQSIDGTASMFGTGWSIVT